MATTVTFLENDISRRRVNNRYTIAFSGNYTVGGDTVDFTKVLNPKLQPGALVRGGNGFAGSLQKAPAGFTGQLIKGTTAKTWLLKLFSAPGAELAAGAYPAAILGDTATVELHGKIGQL